MSLYFDAASILSDTSAGGSLKSRVYGSKLKSPPAQIYALITEASKWDTVLKEVIENAGVLAQEPKLTPLLSLLLTYDLLLSKKGIAAPATHPIRVAIERHKTRLKAELTRCRVRRGCATLEQLKEQLQRDRSRAFSPRWVRINNARTTLERELAETFASHTAVSSLSELANGGERCYMLDPHVPDLLALYPSVELTSSESYRSGRIILQDKASCFPAYLLLGNTQRPWKGDIIDGCAAPGNKTTHLASILSNGGSWGGRECTILSFDASLARSKTLQKMVDVAGLGARVTVFPGQDFLATDPNDPRFKNVTALLLDPSCSGSGIRNREDIPQLALPNPRPKPHKQTQAAGGPTSGRTRKRKRKDDRFKNEASPDSAAAETETQDAKAVDIERLTKLSNVQTQIVEHAFKFPAATRVTYSTCSVHEHENENVVHRLLTSEVARRRGWRIMRRDEQVEGLRAWKHRGLRSPSSAAGAWKLNEVESDACIRCWPDDDEGTGGFFVVGFVRDVDRARPEEEEEEEEEEEDDGDDDESWEGFSSE
ncbi:hypothetical protein VTO42DRAFT_1761 [Malbranchea cinnamomea]